MKTIEPPTSETLRARERPVWLEIDQRSSDGNTITWDWDAHANLHRIRIADADGLQKTLRAADGREARELFHHPFAS